MTRPRLARSSPLAGRFDPRFAGGSPLFWPIVPALSRLLGPLRKPCAPPENWPRGARPPVAGARDGGDVGAFPPVDWFDRVFDGAPDRPVRFVPAAPRPRRRARRRVAIDPGALYDARITLDRVVPTRASSWHDLMNALVWGTFPRAKSALHARQHRAIEARLLPGAHTLPPTRTRELDALALLDEGGVVFPTGDASSVVVFGHAIYESLALGVPPAVVAGIELDAPSAEGDAAGRPSRLRAVDEALARVIADASRLRSPEELRRVDLLPYV